MQVAIDVDEYTAEIYTLDKQLQATLNLGEGRQRDGEELGGWLVYRPMHEVEQERDDLKQQLKQQRAQREQERDDLNQQLKQQRAQREQEREEVAQRELAMKQQMEQMEWMLKSVKQ